MTWRDAMTAALYGPGGFYARGEVPAHHFRTAVHASGAYATAVSGLLRYADSALGHPPRIDLVDVGAGRGELIAQVLAAAGPALARRVRACAVELRPRPAGLPPGVEWRASPPGEITGLVVASEWLDNVPLDVTELTPAGPRLVLVDPATGAERTGPAPSPADRAWASAWWPLREAGDRAEIGRPRCKAWAGVIRRLRRGIAVAADYAHHRTDRPARGTLAGYRDGWAVPPVPDGSRDITAHVALDACAAAGVTAGAGHTLLATQREVLQALGVTGTRPPTAMAASSPLGYLRALCQASADAELIDGHGMGGFGWLVQTVGLPLPPALRALTGPRGGNDRYA
jgi:SAM-dependent MidA family methyltransferase